VDPVGKARAAITAAGRAQAINAVTIHLHTEGDTRNRGWNFREVPRDIIVKAKIQAAVENTSVKALRMDLVEGHGRSGDREEGAAVEREGESRWVNVSCMNPIKAKISDPVRMNFCKCGRCASISLSPMGTGARRLANISTKSDSTLLKVRPTRQASSTGVASLTNGYRSIRIEDAAFLYVVD
jgi:hypothetical protein